MTEPQRRRPYLQRASFDRRELVGARWWHAEQRLAASSARSGTSLAKIAIAAGILGGVGLLAAAAGGAFDPDRSPPSRAAPGGSAISLRPTGFDESVYTRDALAAQRMDGWDVGSADEPLAYPDARDVDATGAPPRVEGLATRLAPVQSSLAPWYVSTLFQCPELPSSGALRAGLRPICSPAMEVAFGRGAGLGSLFEDDDGPSDVAIVADLPGPESVAFAAGLAPRFDAVFTFDNWPHPRGVVPAHLALGAALHYANWLTGHRPAGAAPPCFVLDRNRLAPYADAADRFDNRYVAKLPPAERLSALGVKHVLYVIPEGVPLQELDDLNDDFLAYVSAGIDVKALSLGDLRESQDPAAEPVRSGGPVTRRYHYGGHPTTHPWFWHQYGWRTPRVALGSTEPSSVSRGFEYVPSARPTIFAAGAKPRGFGNVTFHVPSSSHETGSSGRSGSFGRSGSSVSG